MNIVTLSGYIKRIQQARVVSGDNKVLEFTLAVKRNIAREQSKYNFISCTCWRGKADYVEKYAKEGEFAIVTGELDQNSYDDKDGKRVYKTFVNVLDVQIPRLTDSTADEKERESIEGDGYVDVGKTSAKTVNNFYRTQDSKKPNEYEDELPF